MEEGEGWGGSRSEGTAVIVREMELRFIQTFNNLSNLERSPLTELIISFNWPGQEGRRGPHCLTVSSHNYDLCQRGLASWMKSARHKF